MRKKSNQKRGNFGQNLKKFSPYLLVAILVLGVAFWGSRDKAVDEATGLNIQILARNDYSASADQISEFFVVSELATTMNLATAEAVNLNYNSLTSLVEANQTTSEKFEKPTNLTGDCEYETGVVHYKVSQGETIASIAGRYSNCGVTETMIRWSNGLQNNIGVAAGQTIYVPARAGFVHKVKANETVASLASKYKSSSEGIISSNGLELDQNLKVGRPVLIPDGTLPEAERPGYVAPTRPSAQYTAVSTNTYYRLYWTSNNPMPWGWCTWYAWARRAQMGGAYKLPGGLGNANTWDISLAGRYAIDGRPQVGDVFQTKSGWYGHVGIVEAVHPDGSITASDMNGAAGWGRVGTFKITNLAGYKFIHQRR